MITFAGWDKEQTNEAENTIKSFKTFLEENKDDLDALQIIYNQSYKERPLTLEMIKELHSKLKNHPYNINTAKLWESYKLQHGENIVRSNPAVKLADIISLIRFELKFTSELDSFASDVKRKYQKWHFAKGGVYGQFSEEQILWLERIRDHIAISMNIQNEDLDNTPFDNHGGLGKFYSLFGDRYETILKELNYVLVV